MPAAALAPPANCCRSALLPRLVAPLADPDFEHVAACAGRRRPRDAHLVAADAGRKAGRRGAAVRCSRGEPGPHSTARCSPGSRLVRTKESRRSVGRRPADRGYRCDGESAAPARLPASTRYRSSTLEPCPGRHEMFTFEPLTARGDRSAPERRGCAATQVVDCGRGRPQGHQRHGGRGAKHVEQGHQRTSTAVEGLPADRRAGKRGVAGEGAGRGVLGVGLQSPRPSGHECPNDLPAPSDETDSHEIVTARTKCDLLRETPAAVILRAMFTHSRLIYMASVVFGFTAPHLRTAAASTARRASPTLVAGQPVPRQHTADGENISPHCNGAARRRRRDRSRSSAMTPTCRFPAASCTG